MRQVEPDRGKGLRSRTQGLWARVLHDAYRGCAPLAGLEFDRVVAMLGAVMACGILAGCSGPTSINPVDWWHSLEGGPLADARPPPPNADAPYPSLGSVPAKPPPLDPATRAKLASGLVADRDNAKYVASITPIVPAPSGSVPAPPPLAKPTGSDDEGINASLPAASAAPAKPLAPLGPPQPPLPPVTVNPPRKAPVTPVQTAALPPPPAPAAAAAPPPPKAAPSAAPAPPPPAAAASTPPMATASAAAASPDPASSLLPDMPASPPPLVQLPGVSLPQAIAASPPPATPKPPAPAAPPPPQPGAPVAVAFVPGSADLPATALASLKSLAQLRTGRPISVTGYGDAASDQASTQSAALPLALARARAIATDLMAAGVPASDIRIGAEAEGHGGAARIVAN